jgi:hypothetical protein
VTRASHSSSRLSGRAFKAGKEPTIPALHCAITRSGFDTMNIGDAITGSLRRPSKVRRQAAPASDEAAVPTLSDSAPKATEPETAGWVSFVGDFIL